MRFSNKIKYGLQFLLFLDVDTEPYTDILRGALSCDISHKFLEAIAVELKKEGILDVKRGAGGGYKLAKQPDQITLADVFRALSREKPQVEKDEPLNELTRQVVDKIIFTTQQEFWNTMEKTTLLDMQKVYYENTEKLMYYI